MIYLGTINNAGSDVKNNLNTSSPFTIPSWVTSIRVQPSAATQMAAMEYQSDSAFAPASTAMMQLGGANSVNDLPCGRPSAPVVTPTLAIRKTDAGAATCTVFAIAWQDVD
jgi:hypothetical protein